MFKRWAGTSWHQTAERTRQHIGYDKRMNPNIHGELARNQHTLVAQASQPACTYPAYVLRGRGGGRH